MRQSSVLAARLLLPVMAALAAGCGGGADSSSSSPTSPVQSSGTSTLPTGGACAVVGSFAAERPDILKGTTCSPGNTTVVLVNLRDKDNLPSGACSGTIIAPRAVLTAAHCLAGDTAAVRIYRGTGDQLTAESFHVHPRYRENDSSSPDVGVVITSQNLDRSTVPLLASRDAKVGEQAVIAGWGKDELGNGTTLRAAATIIAAVYANFLESLVTATGSGVCSGDSGGPILLSEGGVWSVAGVISASTTGGSCISGTNYYTNIRNPEVQSFVLGLVPDATRR